MIWVIPVIGWSIPIIGFITLFIVIELIIEGERLRGKEDEK